MDDTNKQDLAGIKVMIVDDSSTIRRMVATFLSVHGCEIIEAIDGYDALGMLKSIRPDVIFIDVMMERVDGYTTCAIIRSNPLCRNIPIIMLTSKAGIFDVARGKLCGATQYLTKPFKSPVLHDTVRKVLGMDEGEAA